MKLWLWKKMLVLRRCMLKYIGANVIDLPLTSKSSGKKMHALYTYIFRKGERGKWQNINNWGMWMKG